MPYNRTRRRVLAIAVVAALLPTSWALRSAAGATATAAPYKIGVTYPLSGPLGAWGQLLLPAIKIAAQNLNKAGGVNGRPLALVVEDSKGNPEGAVSAMRKLVQVDHVAVIVTIFTNVVNAQMPLADQLKVPIISTVETPGLVAKSKWAFAHSTLISQTLPLLVARWKHVHVKHLFAFLPNSTLGKYVSPIFKAAAEKIGSKYDQALFKLGEADFRGLITRAKSWNPDAILIYGYGTPDEGRIMQQIRELGMNTQIYGACACVTAKSYREAAGKAANGEIYAGFKYDPIAAKKLIDPYRAKLGFSPDYAGLEAYDMVFMVADAIKKYGYSGDAIRRGLSEIKDFRSIGGGLVSMDKTGQTSVAVGLYQVKDVSKSEFVEINP